MPGLADTTIRLLGQDPLAGLLRTAEQLQVAEIRRRQADGLISDEFDPAALRLLAFAMCSYPRLLPQVTRMATGHAPDSPEFRELMAFEAERARAYLAEGLRLLQSLDRRSALCVGTFAGLYRETLDRIEAGAFDVFGEKTQLSTPRKLAVVARGLLS